MRNRFLSSGQRLISRVIVTILVLQNFAFVATSAQAAVQQGAFVSPMVATGYQHSLFLKSDGTVWASGDNTFGQLGDASAEPYTNVAVQVPSLSDIKAVAAGYNHSLALKSDGTVWAWGSGVNGKLGNGSNSNSDIPVQVSGLTGAIAISAGHEHSLALKSDGTVRAWGDNSGGALGNGNSPTDSNTPVTVTGLSNVTGIAGGMWHSLAVLSDGTVRAWGPNSSGELGNGNNTDSDTPVTVSGISTAKAVAGGGGHSLALLSDGTVRAWGYNWNGQLGNGATLYTSNDSNVPVTVSGLSNVKAIDADDGESFSLKADGTVWTWGYNADGELGDGTYSDSNVPVQVLDEAGGPGFLSGVTALAVGNFTGLAVRKSNGAIRGWGTNDWGQFADGTWTDNPTPVPSLVNLYVSPNSVIAVDAGVDHGVALRRDGTVWAWGSNSDGQLGNNTLTDSNIPVQVHGVGNVGFLTDVVAISGNGWHCLAIKSDGTVVGWGANWSGQLGDNTTTSSSVPVVTSVLTGAVAVSAGSNHSVGLKADGTVWTWGSNSYGQLGDGSFSESHVPIQVSSFSGAVGILGTRGSSYALKSDGTIRAWGDNGNGQLGNGSNSTSNVPVTVSGFSGGKSVAGDEWGALALKSDGTVWAWGLGTSGQLGNGANASSNVPVQVDDTDLGFEAIAIGSHGGESNLVVRADGTVWAWGYNEAGELGNGTGGDYTNAFDSNVPVQVSSMSGAVASTEGGGFSFVIKSDGTLWSFGYNGLGELGNCSNTDTNTPVQVLFSGCPIGPTPNTTDNYVVLSREAVNATASATVHFVLNNTLSSPLTVTFDAAFSGMNVSSASAITPATPGCMTNFAVTNGHSFTADKSSCTGEVIITGITVVNPGAAGPYLVSWTNDDDGYAMVAIVDSDQVMVNAQVSPTITFDLNANADNSADAAPYSVPLGPLTVGAVTHSDNGSIPSVWANLDTNATSGAVVTVLSENAALASASVPGDTIPNAAAAMLAGTANYGLCVESVTGPTTTAGTFQASSPYDVGTCDPAGDTNDVKALSTITPTTILDTASGPVVTGAAEILVNAAISTSTVAHSDYTDVLTFVATGTF